MASSTSENNWAYPPVGYHFEVSVGQFSGVDNLFSEVSGLEMELETTTELKEGGNNSYVHHLPGRTKYTDLVLKRGVVPKKSNLLRWCQETITGNYTKKIKTRTITVKLLDEAGKPLISWNFKNAYPKKLALSNLNAKASGESAIMIETITIAYSEFERQ